MVIDSDRGCARVSFTVPVGAGIYAPEEIYCKVEPTAPSGYYSIVSQLRVLIENLIATAVVEIWVLRVGGNAASAGDWFYSGISHNAAGLSALIELASIQGVKLRAKSGGTAGAMLVDAFWE
jgi:hypothetical protein